MTDYENVGALAYDRDGPTGLTDIASYVTRGRPSWFARGACLDHAEVSWFPERGEPAKPAKDICATCPVRIACANHALRNGERFGVWGGLSERQRGVLRRSTWLTDGADRPRRRADPKRGW